MTWTMQVNPNNCRERNRGRVLSKLGGRLGKILGHVDPWLRRLALGLWNVTSLVGQEPEIVQED